MLKVINKSNLSGKENSMEINCNLNQFLEADANYRKGELIQEAFSFLNPSEREFLKTGITDEEWDKLFG